MAGDLVRDSHCNFDQVSQTVNYVTNWIARYSNYLSNQLSSSQVKAMKPVKEIKIQRPKREKVTREEAIKRVKAFPKRMEKLIAAIRESKNRNIHS